MTTATPDTPPSAGTPPSAAPDLVDTHQHFWDLAAYDQPWLALPGKESLLRNFTEADLRPLAAAAGVTATVIVQTVAEPGETPDLLTIAAASDLVTGVVGWVDLQADGVADALAALQDRPDGWLLRGIRHPVLIEADPDWLRRPAVRRGLAAVGLAGLCYDLVVPADLLPAAADAVAACPDLTFVLDHLGNPDVGTAPHEQTGPDEHWARWLRRIGALPNAYCKLSGILSDADPDRLVPYYETAIEAFGPDRLMFGSDWPVCTVSASYDTVLAAARELTAALSPAERTAIFSGTAHRAYRLPGQA
ncbi:MAG TPA: amidohydrolase family protein [Streptosporangiaceae bacterium]|nr:amidohydrolase family protein [Streptosporangiaceae bacterium]